MPRLGSPKLATLSKGMHLFSADHAVGLFCSCLLSLRWHVCLHFLPCHLRPQVGVLSCVSLWVELNFYFFCDMWWDILIFLIFPGVRGNGKALQTHTLIHRRVHNGLQSFLHPSHNNNNKHDVFLWRWGETRPSGKRLESTLFSFLLSFSGK